MVAKINDLEERVDDLEGDGGVDVDDLLQRIDRLEAEVLQLQRLAGLRR